MITSKDNVTSELEPEVIKARKAIVSGRQAVISVTVGEAQFIADAGLLGGTVERPKYQGIDLYVTE